MSYPINSNGSLYQGKKRRTRVPVTANILVRIYVSRLGRWWSHGHLSLKCTEAIQPRYSTIPLENPRHGEPNPNINKYRTTGA